LWLPPLTDLDGGDPVERARALVPLELVRPPRVLDTVRHGITHRRITVHPVVLEVSGRDADRSSGRWVDPGDHGLPTSSLFGKLCAARDL
jgi:hypothetical protein